MKMKYLSVLAISYCIQYLENRPIGTTYHPKKDIFLLDGKTATKIIKYEGNLKATTTPSETRFFTQMLKQIVNETNIFKSITNNEKYYISEETKYNRYSIKFERTGLIRNLRGRKPEYIGSMKNVQMAND